jgi:signal transduction histidine kinase
VRSTVGEGTTFTVTLPTCQGRPASNDEPESI